MMRIAKKLEFMKAKVAKVCIKIGAVRSPGHNNRYFCDIAQKNGKKIKNFRKDLAFTASYYILSNQKCSFVCLNGKYRVE